MRTSTKIAIWLVAFSAGIVFGYTAFGQTYSLPSKMDGTWQGNVGVDGGFRQYLAGAGSDRATTGTVYNITSYGADPDDPQTTGTVSSGALSTLTVADATDFDIGEYVAIDSGWTERREYTIDTAATADGNVQVYWHYQNKYVPILSGDSAATIAQKIRDYSEYPGNLVTSGSGTTVVLESTTATNIQSTGTGIKNMGTTGSSFSPVSGRDGNAGGTTHEITGKSGNDLTISPARTYETPAGVDVFLDAFQAIQDAFDAAIANPGSDVVYIPNGLFRIHDDTFTLDATYSGETLRGESRVGAVLLCGRVGQGVFISGVGGTYDSNVQQVTGTKTKGTATLTVSDGTEYAVGQLVKVEYQNEERQTQIEAGASPTWGAGGNQYRRYHLAEVTANSATTITIEPPLLADCTGLTINISETATPTSNLESFGFESFTLRPMAGRMPDRPIEVGGRDGWIYDVLIDDFDEGPLLSGYRNTYAKNIFFGGNPNLDGPLMIRNATRCLIEDNMWYGIWPTSQQGTGDTFFIQAGVHYNAFCYNFWGATNRSWVMHRPSPSLNLFEGNVYGGLVQADGFHGSASENVLFREYITGRNYYSDVVLENDPLFDVSVVSLNRFSWNWGIVGCAIGTPGETSGAVSTGNPNIGNPTYFGTANPTAGTPTWWGDWVPSDTLDQFGVRATILTRINDNQAVLQMPNSNHDFSTSRTEYDAGRSPDLWSATSRVVIKSDFAVTARDDGASTITISRSAGDPLPEQGSTVIAFGGHYGFQERDDGVAATLELEQNVYSQASGGWGTLQDDSGDALPDSLVYAAQPSWWTDDGFSGNWPPIDPDSPPTVEGPSLLPAGARWAAITGYVVGDLPAPQTPPARVMRLHFDGTGVLEIRLDGTGHLQIKTD